MRDYPTNLSEYEKYYKKGGSYELPTEIFLDLLEENNRLNNIINEFDKWLDKESEKENYSVGHLTCLMMSKVRLQELKDSDKE